MIIKKWLKIAEEITSTTGIPSSRHPFTIVATKNTQYNTTITAPFRGHDRRHSVAIWARVVNFILSSFLLLASILLGFPSVSMATQESWTQWVAGVRQEALSQGIPASLFDDVFADIHEPSKQVKNLAKSQPEHRLSYQKYLNTRIDNYRIVVGRREFKKNQEVLENIGRDFGVDPCFIVAFWGMESSYGSYMGDFPVIRSLATLAYDSNRKEFFRKELLLALHILNDGHVTLERFKGEWAGASGQPQFLPSSWTKYAVDYDGDGRKDIWQSKPDVFASIANYMKKNGWQTGEPWAVYVKLPADFDKRLEGKATVKLTSDWNTLGVRTTTGAPLPHPQLAASVIQPFGGPVFLAYPNYKMILHYNNSIYYAGAIGYLADKICQRTNN